MKEPAIDSPGKRRQPSPVLTLRLSEAMLEKLAAYAKAHGITRAVAIRRLIAQGLDRG